MEFDWLQQNIKLLIGLKKEPPEFIGYKVLSIETKDGYEQQLIEYYNDGNRINVLQGLAFVDPNRVGTLGHSYGGNTVLFHMAVDRRISFGCASRSACTYKNRMDHNVGIEMASVISGFNEQYDIDDLVKCISPRKLLLVSANDDKYPQDADDIYQKVKPIYEYHNAGNQLQHKRYDGGHAMTKERFIYIVNWFSHHINS